MPAAAQKQPETFHLDTNGETAPPAPKWVTVRLARAYRPMERPNSEYKANPKEEGKFLPPVFEVVGYWQDEIKRKRPDGKEVVIQPREFIKTIGTDGTMLAAPPVLAGTGFANKLWPNTVIRVLKDEAKFIRDNNIGTVEVDDD